MRVIPDGDILPTRAKYSHESNDYQVALNHLYASSDDPNEGLWFALPDLVASVILTGRIPKIVDAFRIVPKGQLAGLRPIDAARCRDDRSAPARLLSHRDRGAQASCFQHGAFRRRTSAAR